MRCIYCGCDRMRKVSIIPAKGCYAAAFECPYCYAKTPQSFSHISQDDADKIAYKAADIVIQEKFHV